METEEPKVYKRIQIQMYRLRLYLKRRPHLLLLLLISLAMCGVVLRWSRQQALSSTHYISAWEQDTSGACRARQNPFLVEDLFCKIRPKFLSNFKNPCWYDYSTSGHRKLRCIPFFHLLGTDKCGTSDLFDRLAQHPEVEPCWPRCDIGKESYFWSWTRYGVWYSNLDIRNRTDFLDFISIMDQAAARIEQHHVNGYHDRITGDGTPMDVWDFRGWNQIPQNEGFKEPRVLTPHLMKHIYPNPRFIIMYRNPAERLYSGYYYYEYGDSPSKFHTDTVRALAMMRECLQHNTTRQCFYNQQLFHALPMRLAVSCYSVYLKEWFKVFSRERFLIIRTEDYQKDIRGHLEKVISFLGLSSLSAEDLDMITHRENKMVTHTKQKAGPMWPETRALLDAFYKPFTEDLADMLQDRRFLWQDIQFDGVE